MTCQRHKATFQKKFEWLERTLPEEETQFYAIFQLYLVAKSIQFILQFTFKVRICYHVSILSNPAAQYFLFDVKTTIDWDC